MRILTFVSVLLFSAITAQMADAHDVTKGDLVISTPWSRATQPGAAVAAGYVAITNKGTWNASTNSPALSTGVGTIGDTYKVSVAGSTTLDGVTSWAAGDYAVFDGVVWRKGEDSQRFEGGVIAMLAVRVADEMGVQPSASLTAASLSAWSSIRSAFITPPLAQFDSGLVRTYLTEGSTAPYPWPPSLEGKIYDWDGPAPTMTEADHEALASEGQR